MVAGRPRDRVRRPIVAISRRVRRHARTGSNATPVGPVAGASLARHGRRTDASSHRSVAGAPADGRTTATSPIRTRTSFRSARSGSSPTELLYTADGKIKRRPVRRRRRARHRIHRRRLVHAAGVHAEAADVRRVRARSRCAASCTRSFRPTARGRLCGARRSVADADRLERPPQRLTQRRLRRDRSRLVARRLGARVLVRSRRRHGSLGPRPAGRSRTQARAARDAGRVVARRIAIALSLDPQRQIQIVDVKRGAVQQGARPLERARPPELVAGRPRARHVVAKVTRRGSAKAPIRCCACSLDGAAGSLVRSGAAQVDRHARGLRPGVVAGRHADGGDHRRPARRRFRSRATARRTVRRAGCRPSSPDRRRGRAIRAASCIRATPASAGRRRRRHACTTSSRSLTWTARKPSEDRRPSMPAGCSTAAADASPRTSTSSSRATASRASSRIATDLHAGTVVDASNETVIPGLIEIHTHLSKDYGEALGRIWLSFGHHDGAQSGDQHVRGDREPRSVRIGRAHRTAALHDRRAVRRHAHLLPGRHCARRQRSAARWSCSARRISASTSSRPTSGCRT